MPISLHRLEGLVGVERLRAQLADAIIGADPFFFSTLTRLGIDVHAALDSLLTDSSSDIGVGWAGVLNDEVAGLVVFAHARDVKARQLRSFAEYFRRVGDRKEFAAAMREFAARKQPMIDDSIYLSRIFIAKYQRGSGLSSDLMTMFIEAGRASAAKCCSLHVHRDNHAARRLYERLSFSPVVDAEAFDYQLMVRNLA